MGTETQMARFNWWGSSDGPSDADGLSGATGSGDGVTQFVDFDNFKTIRPTDCFDQIFLHGFEDPT